jgi:predicted DNA-binding transcriptional regulator AlpA
MLELTDHHTEIDSFQQKSAQSEKISIGEHSREAALADPILSFRELIADSGTSHSTFYRSIKPQLEVVKISPRRRGVRSSVWNAWKAGVSKQAGA